MNDSKIPSWVNIFVLPLINIMFAFAFAAGIFIAVDVNPIEAAGVMVRGALGYQEGIGYTLYYATNFIFTGLAVAMAFSAGLFNIGGEGQAYMGGLGVGLACLALDSTLPFWALLPITMLASMLFGALFALIPAYLQAYRGSHIVITTIMFNFIASALMVYLLVNVLKLEGQMAPVSRVFDENAGLPMFHEIAAWFGFSFSQSPMNLSFFIALICCVLVWALLWRTRWGYAIRAMGASPSAAEYGGISYKKLIIVVMLISGALSGMMGLNEVQGYSQQLKLDFVAGYGFTGIAVCLIGRSHPIGIILASILFGVLYQGGAELSFDYPNIDREMIQVVQALVVLFSGALALMLVKPTEKLFVFLNQKKAAIGSVKAEA
ncbi:MULTISPECIES: ABC transporter permease [Shewanella]|uniref:ABC transporter permease n=1 Tax=Shewanella sairae TaxID=190310 RepID=A0ABQ4P765_9GAMM|nr:MULTISPECIES: ABC transporter permease [Shewanella]MCL1128857.1 ABC transporter permease [Shewanella sairae]MCL1145648.1 ABC transporter permease [Shewanella marinintestina]GIU06974.1 ABC transporter permease [Shewanella sp. MBTL60-112-B1]GIU26106.1 ABC transporter permease [Shewanella sp. MBTL60-112-B2]GIU43374.1 ABC transporter permease [Shewanella sairae]